MLRTNLCAYVTSTCLANAFFIGGALQPAHARPIELSAPSNLLEGSTSISSSQDCPYRALLHNRDTDNYSSRFNWSEIQDFETVNSTTDGHILYSILDSQLNKANLDASINEHDLDSLLNSQFEQREVLLARCCQ